MSRSPAVEPFAELIGPAPSALSPASYRFGYRTTETRDIIAAIDLPAELVERAVTAGLLISATMTPDGKITMAVLSSTRDITLGPAWVPVHVEDLVASAVHPENLRMEEATAADLKSLLQRLERSVNFVKVAINKMANRTRDPY